MARILNGFLSTVFLLTWRFHEVSQMRGTGNVPAWLPLRRYSEKTLAAPAQVREGSCSPFLLHSIHLSSFECTCCRAFTMSSLLHRLACRMGQFRRGHSAAACCACMLPASGHGAQYCQQLLAVHLDPSLHSG